jgi:GT2 family glycosyltransferase
VCSPISWRETPSPLDSGRRVLCVFVYLSREQSRSRGDGTPDLVRSEFPEVDLVSLDTNVQFCGSNNRCFDRCSGEFVCLFNPYLVLEPDVVKRLASYVTMSPHIAIVGSFIDTRGSCIRYADVFLIDGVVKSREDLLSDLRCMAAPCGAAFFIGEERRLVWQRHDGKPQ